MGLVILITVIMVLVLSYRLYVTPMVDHNINPSWKRSTPSRRQMDGEEYFPTRLSLLSSFQLRSISLDVIISPIIAVQFGWLPAILWLLIGTIFFGWVQDYLSTIISVRSAGKSLTQLFEIIFDSRTRKLISWFLYIYLLIIFSQFSLLLSSLFSRAEVPVMVFIIVLVALLTGFVIYRARLNMVIISFISIAVALFGIWLSATPRIQEVINPINQYLISLGTFGSSDSIINGVPYQMLAFLLMVFMVCYLGALLPTWRFAVPFNHVSNWLVIIGFSIAVIGLVVGTLKGSINPSLEIPPIITAFQPHIGPIWPMMFVVLSAGAVSGWHALVSSFTTSHQVEKEPQVKPVTTWAMYAETIIVIIIIIFAAIFGVSSGLFNPDGNFVLVSGAASVFAAGFTATWNAIGAPPAMGASFSAILLTLMGLSILHLVLRYARVIQREIFRTRVRLFNNAHISTLTVLLISLLIILFGLREWLWTLFAGVNMLLAALVLMLATVWLADHKKAYWWTYIPSILLFLTGLAALGYSSLYQVFVQDKFSAAFETLSFSLGNLVLVVAGIFFSVTASYIFFIGLRQVRLRSAT